VEESKEKLENQKPSTPTPIGVFQGNRGLRQKVKKNVLRRGHLRKEITGGGRGSPNEKEPKSGTGD